MSTSIIKHLPVLLACTVLPPACQWNVGTVEVHLVYTSNSNNNPLSEDLISRLHVRLEGDGMRAKEIEIDAHGDESGVLSDIPLGKNRVLTVEGLDNAGFVKSRGVSTPFDTESGNTEIYLFISQVGKFSEPPFGGTVGTGFSKKYKTQLAYLTRVFHTATALPDGEVLIVGGLLTPGDGGFFDSVYESFRDAGRFDTTAGAFFRDEGFSDCNRGRLCTRASLGRSRHSAGLLPGGTHVVVVGGEPVVPDRSEGGEYYSIETRTFENFIEVTQPRSRHASAVLSGARQGVLVAGGVGDEPNEMLSDVEVFEAGRFEPLGIELIEPRAGGVAVAVPDGVLVIGGWSAENVASRKVDYIEFDGDGSTPFDFEMGQARAEHSAVLLEEPGGEPRIFVCGGLFHDGASMQIADTCELLLPKQLRSEPLDLTVERWGHAATALRDGRVLISGGFYTAQEPLQAKATALLFDVPVGMTQPQSIVTVSPRAGHTSTLLQNGMVLLVGGVRSIVAGTTTMSSLYEIFNPPL